VRSGAELLYEVFVIRQQVYFLGLDLAVSQAVKECGKLLRVGTLLLVIYGILVHEGFSDAFVPDFPPQHIWWHIPVNAAHGTQHRQLPILKW